MIICSWCLGVLNIRLNVSRCIRCFDQNLKSQNPAEDIVREAIAQLEDLKSKCGVMRRDREVVDFTRSRVKNNTELTNLGN